MPVSLGVWRMGSLVARVVAHLDLDGTGVAAWASRGKDQQGKLLVQALEPVGQIAGTGDPGGEPEAAHQEQGVAEADATRGHARPLGHLGHVQADQVVGDRQPPHLLEDALGEAAAEGFLALQGMGQASANPPEEMDATDLQAVYTWSMVGPAWPC